MLAAADSLITLLIFAALALLSHWLQQRRKRQEEEQEEQGVPPPIRPRERPATPPRPQNWEEELRRLLQGEAPSPPPAAPVPPPLRPKLPPSSPPAPAPPRVTEKPSAGGGSVAGALQAYLESRGRSRPAGEGARAGATQIEREVAERVRPSVTAPVAPQRPAVHRAAPPEAAQVRAWLRERRTVRAALLAAVILGPPKAAERQPGYLPL